MFRAEGWPCFHQPVRLTRWAGAAVLGVGYMLPSCSCGLNGSKHFLVAFLPV